MERRRFLHAAALGAAGAAAGATGWLARPRSRAQMLAHPVLLELLGDVDSVRAVGLTYRHSFPHEQTSQALERALLRSVGPAARLSDRLLRARVDARVQADFDTGDVVQIGGWILSRTEARQCALFTLLYS
jgi:hypothetical protein